MKTRTGMLAITLVLLVAVTTPESTWGQKTAPRPEKELVAVLELERKGATDVEATAISDRLREELLQTGRFSLVDRGQMDKVLAEQAVQQSGCTTQECAVQVGRILGVRKLVAGRLTKISDSAWLVSVQLINVESAETEVAQSIRHRGDYLSLLEQAMTDLASLMAGLPSSAGRSPAGRETGGQIQVAVPARQSSTGARGLPDRLLSVRRRIIPLAVLPIAIAGTISAQDQSSMVEVLKEVLAQLPDTKITHSFNPAIIAGQKIEAQEIESKGWSTFGGLQRDYFPAQFGKIDSEALLAIRANIVSGTMTAAIVEPTTGFSVEREATFPATPSSAEGRARLRASLATILPFAMDRFRATTTGLVDPLRAALLPAKISDPELRTIVLKSVSTFFEQRGLAKIVLSAQPEEVAAPPLPDILALWDESWTFFWNPNIEVIVPAAKPLDVDVLVLASATIDQQSGDPDTRVRLFLVNARSGKLVKSSAFVTGRKDPKNPQLHDQRLARSINLALFEIWRDYRIRE